MRRRLAQEQGFTVVELLATMAILAVILTAFGQMLITTSRTSNRVQEQATLQDEVRAAVDQLTTDLRAATNANGTTPIEALGGSTLQFLSPDRATPFHLRRIAYRLVGGVLQRSVTTSSDTDGWPWVWPATAGPWVQVLDSITSPSPFTFLDAGGVATTDPTAVHSVRVALTVAPRQAQGGSMTYTALATIRTQQ